MWLTDSCEFLIHICALEKEKLFLYVVQTFKTKFDLRGCYFTMDTQYALKKALH